EAGEPANRARQIDIRPHLLAPVTLNIHHHPSAGAMTTAPTPLRKGQRKPSEQHMVDAAMERRRYPRQQRLRERNRKREREPTRRAQGVARRLEPAIDQRPRGLAQHTSPKRNRAAARRPPRHPAPATKAVPPPAETRCPAPATPAPRRAQSPPTPPQAQAPGCATTPRQPQDDGYSAADDRTDAHRHQTTPPAPLPQPQAKAGSPPRALARRCTPHAPQHQHHQCRSVAGSPPHPPPQPAPPPAASPPLPPPPPAAATHRDDQAQPAAPKSDQPHASPPAPAAASPD